MLALTRRVNEVIIVGCPERPMGSFRIITIRDGRIKFAFEFRRSIQVHRKELAERLASADEDETRRSAINPDDESTSVLAITRNVGNEIVIGDPAAPYGTIRVVSTRGDKVRLAFDFQEDIQINRAELAERKRRDMAQN